MSVYHRPEYNCDRCGKKLKTCNNDMDIVTKKEVSGNWWERLHVQIIYHHGIHNDATREDADLCRDCAILLLQDAIKRIRKGERRSAGSGEVDEQKWEEK